MAIHPLLAKAQSSSIKPELPTFDIGDTVEIHFKVKEAAKSAKDKDGEKEQIRVFTGIVISRRGTGTSENIVVRRIVDNEGVERTFPLHSPKLVDIVVKRQSKVRRAKLFFLRERVGKKAFTLKERVVVKVATGRKRTRIKARKAKAADEAAQVAAKAEKKAKKKKTKTNPTTAD